MLRYDVNSGPLTLIHDPTPRSLDQNLNNPTTTVGNFRKKGFVNYNFVRPRIPRTIPAPDLLPSSDDPKVDLKPPSPKKSVGSPQKSVASIPKSASPGKSTGLPSPVRAPASATKPGSKGSAQHSAMDGRRSHQSQRRDLTSRSSHNRLHQSDSAMGTGRNYSDEYDSTQNVPIRNAHQKSHEQIKKETQQFLDRREEERRFQEESELRKREKHEDQRRAREMMEESGPFGRPGAGAPNGNDYKKQKFREEQFQRDPPRYQVEPNPEMAREADQGLDGMPPFHSPGRNGMPSERQRYDMTKENLQKLRMQNEMLERTSPGPQHMPDGYMKNRGGFGPNYGHFERDRRGISSPRSAPETDPKFLENPYDDLGRQKFTLKPSKIPPLEPWGPWGRSGGGAPRTDPKGNLITPIAGLMDRSSEDHFVRDGKKEEERMQEKINQRRYRSDLDLQVAQNARKGEEQQRHKNESQRDYAEIIDSRRRRPRSKNHLPRSDISLARDGTVRPNPIEAEKYRESLDVGSTEKEVDHKLNQLKDYQAARQHHEYFSSYWGRPGGGNRAHEKYTNKANLDRLLNNEQGPGRFSMKDVYVKGKDWSQFNEKEITPRFESQDDISPRYARVTVDSYHANQYDYPYTGPTGKKEYEMRSPWAQH